VAAIRLGDADQAAAHTRVAGAHQASQDESEARLAESKTSLTGAPA
jgi:hypothetical protein